MSFEVYNSRTGRGVARSEGSYAGRVTRAIGVLRERLDQPRALSLRPDQQAAVERAAERVAAQLTGDTDPVLTIALAGGSGVGKSTIINALAGSNIAEAAEMRPCTMQPTIYHHRDVPDGGLPVDLVASARGVVHDRPELRFKVVVDTPDLDSFATQNRLATRAMLKAAGLVLYVFTPEKYWDERVWSVIREEQRFSACLVLLNKSDTVTPATLDRAAEEIRRRFTELGKPDIAVLRIAASHHLAGNENQGAPAVDEFSTLRAYIEHELHEGDIARMRREQRLRVVENLQAELDRALPAEVGVKLDALARLADTQADDAADRLTPVLADAFFALENELRPTIALRQHQLFTGPFRLWLAVGDFLVYSLPAAIRRIRSLTTVTASFETLLTFQAQEAIEVADRAGDAAVRDALFAQGLPVGHWQLIASETSAPSIPRALTREVQNRFESVAARTPARLRWVARAASGVGAVLPIGLAAYALFSVLVRLATGQPAGGLDMLGLVFSLTILSYVVLHGVVATVLWGTQPRPAHDLSKQCTRAVFARRLGERIDRYRQDLEDDVNALHGPLKTLRVLAESPIERSSYAPAPPRPVRSSAPVEQPPTQPEEPPIAVVESPPAAAPPEPDDVISRPVEPEGESPPRPALRPSEIFRQAVERHASKG